MEEGEGGGHYKSTIIIIPVSQCIESQCIESQCRVSM